MKLRCIHNSIRLRLRKSEVEQLLKQAVQETVHFPAGNSFQFVLKLDDQIKELQAIWNNNQQLCINIPTTQGEKWIGTSQVGIETNLPLSDGEKLHLLIEKDFPCKDREEDKTDFFGELVDGDTC